MWLDRNASVWRWLMMIAGILAGLALAATAEGAHGKSRSGHAVVTYQSADTMPGVPELKDTPANLQGAFDNEVNAKERYIAFMGQARAEGRPAVARLFRALADAESIHAHRFVEGIAATGGTARAVLERVEVRSTDENLRTALRAESWEAERYYPALLERARAEHWPIATRALTGALATEREHVRLLTAALVAPEGQVASGPLFVCSYCGRTVEHPDTRKCPQCFTSSRRYIKVR
jgi:rubrerythrin